MFYKKIKDDNVLKERNRTEKDIIIIIGCKDKSINEFEFKEIYCKWVGNTNRDNDMIISF